MGKSIQINSRVLVYSSLCLLIMYYFFSLANLLKISPTITSIAKVSDITKSLSSEKKTRSHTYVTFLRYLHKKDSEVNYSLGTYFENHGEQTQAKSFYKRAIEMEPQNFGYMKTYLNLISTTEADAALVMSEMYDIFSYVFPEMFSQNLSREQFLPISLKSLLAATDVDTINKNYHTLFYLLGLEILTYNPTITKQLWMLSKDIYPDLGHYHVELASLAFYAFSDEDAAKKILRDCQQFFSPAQQCKEHVFYPLPTPGSFYEPITKW